MKPIYVLLFLFVASCTSLKNNTVNDSIEEATTPIASKIIFLNYKISKNSDTDVELSLINKITTDGNIKKKRQTKTNNSTGDLICIQQDINSKAIDSFYIENPLIKNIEYSDTSGKLSRKKIELDSTTISIRMDLKPQTEFITLKLLNNTNNSLLKIQL